MPYEMLKIELYNNLRGVNEKASEYITADGFFLNLRNYGFERPGAISSRPGTTDFASLGFQSFLAKPAGIHQYSYFASGVAESFLAFDSGNKLYAFTNVPQFLGESLTPNATTAYPIDYLTANDKLYHANGYFFGSYHVSLHTYYSVPRAEWFASGGNVTFIGVTNTLGVTIILPSGTYAIKFAYSKGYTSDNEVGEINSDSSSLPVKYYNLAATFVGKSAEILAAGFTVPPGYAISNVVPYVAFPGTSNYIAYPTPVPWTLDGVGRFTLDLFLETFTGTRTYDNIAPFTLVPAYIGVYKNMLFMAGFSSALSTVWYSELGELENVQPENFFEIRTGNGDKVTCLRNFQNTLIVFKYNSVHEINGDSPETLSLKDMTLEYGCVNNSAAVTFENKLWFVDRRGICEYQGSNTYIVSDAVQNTFATLDVSKAKAFHIKKRNEVWFCFGDVALVYNYHESVQGWSIYDGIAIEHINGSSVIRFADGTIDLSYVITGSSHYPLVRFSDTVYQDRGQDITLIAQAPFFKRLGDSTQELFRRFYLDADVPGSTTGVTVNLKPDYGSSIYVARSFYLDAFQKRVEFGISAKSLSPEWVIKARNKITVNGYALHARYLRAV